MLLPRCWTEKMSPAFFPARRSRVRILGLQPRLRSDLGACKLRNLRDESVAELEVVRSRRSARVGELIRQEDLSEFADRRLEPALIQRGAHADDLLEKGAHGTSVSFVQVRLELEEDRMP